METLLVDKGGAETFLPAMAAQLWTKHVELRADETALKLLDATRNTQHGDKLKPAHEQDWFTEYNDYILNVRVVEGVRAAIDHINYYGSAHSGAIVTRNEARASQFLAERGSATVYWDAATGFTDGG